MRMTKSGVALIVGSFLLALAVVGGLLAVKQYGEQARRHEALQIAEEKLRQETSGTIALNEVSDETAAQSHSETHISSTSEPSVTELPQTGSTSVAMSILLSGVGTYAVAYGVMALWRTARVYQRVGVRS